MRSVYLRFTPVGLRSAVTCIGAVRYVSSLSPCNSAHSQGLVCSAWLCWADVARVTGGEHVVTPGKLPTNQIVPLSACRKPHPVSGILHGLPMDGAVVCVFITSDSSLRFGQQATIKSNRGICILNVIVAEAAYALYKEYSDKLPRQAA